MSNVSKSAKSGTKSAKSAKSANVANPISVHVFTVRDRSAVLRSIFTPYGANRGIVGFIIDDTAGTVSFTVDSREFAPQSFDGFVNRLVDRDAIAF